ncbi:hypothetical protein L593_04720 [Salinarchaeum sp. Harcht-Bsk1]|uniref:DUF5811 family protein n=1 Tax=Salinarchaeum sp. Harcht-Bsk1 TaxID=1333523 RepID=UPI0003423786|nr:DUF5811 family protein [Salinarchaeum sp. Harcht-Bsk1]AGN00893.1 hypothetical protein L593_04720 [Salinarchaeum sp. Harcht-Bsk1]
MNGNTPYAGQPGTTQAGKRANDDLVDLSSDEKRRFRQDVTRIATRTREFLPDEYAIDADISHSAGGPQGRVAVQPPVGHPVTAGFTPNEEDFDAENVVDDEDVGEVARGLAASAALQVKQAVANNVTPTAR